MEEVLTIIVGAVIVAFSATYIWFWKQSTRWPKVEAHVERCERATLNLTQYSASRPKAAGIRLYYSFKVRGDYYGGHFAEIGFSLESQIEDFVNRFKQGVPVIVRYNPKNP